MRTQAAVGAYNSVAALRPRPPGTCQLQDETGFIDLWPQENSTSQGTMGCLRTRCWRGLFIGLGLCEVSLGNVVTTQRQYNRARCRWRFSCFLETPCSFLIPNGQHRQSDSPNDGTLDGSGTVKFPEVGDSAIWSARRSAVDLGPQEKKREHGECLETVS